MSGKFVGDLKERSEERQRKGLKRTNDKIIARVGITVNMAISVDVAQLFRSYQMCWKFSRNRTHADLRMVLTSLVRIS
jgi:hypothetical protein